MPSYIMGSLRTKQMSDMPLTLHAYRLATWLLAPLAPFFLHLRLLRGQENGARLNERRGRAGKQRPDGQVLWVHAASVGEVISVFPLIDKLLEANQELHVLLTSGTVTSADIVARYPRKRMIHQFVPLDLPHYTKRFIRHWHPDAAIFIESEIWPNILRQITQLGAPLALVNGRMSMNSFANWQQAPKTIKKLLSYFDILFAQDEITARRLAELGGDNITMQGNLKLDATPLYLNEENYQILSGQIGARPLWLAACTHNPEEYIAAKTHISLVSEHKNLLTIIAPRHPNRGDAIKQQCAELGLKIARRSLGEKIEADTDIYLADTIGEMGLFYHLADITFMGGSLMPHGGQNPIEAAQIGMALITGSHIENFTAVYRYFEKAAACLKIKDDVELIATVNRLLSNPKFVTEMKESAAQTVQANGGTVQNIYEKLRPVLPIGGVGGKDSARNLARKKAREA